MYFADLASETQIDTGDHVRAIGWLAIDHEFSVGEVSREFATRLRALCETWGLSTGALWWPAAGGAHRCEFCGDYRSGGNLGIPAGRLLFVAPQMVSHYVDAHRYRPPDPFIRAVLDCPNFGTRDFEIAVQRFREINIARVRSRDHRR